MNKKICELCGTKLISGKLFTATPPDVLFYPFGQEYKTDPQRSTIHCEACPKCGHIQNLTLTSPDKIFGENGE